MSDKHSKIIRNKRENRREKEMKNKIISAMLVGMSATMAVPATAVFAADETESGYREGRCICRVPAGC